MSSIALNHCPDVFAALPFRQGEKDVPRWDYCSDYVRQHHPSNFSSTVDKAFKSMTDYHNSVVKICSGSDSSLVTENFIDNVLKEYCKLLAMAQAHLPLNDGVIHRKFVFHWTDSFRDSKNISANSNLELVSCVYNIAAAYSHLGMFEAQHGTGDSVRVAYNHFLMAAGYYQLTDKLLSRLPSDLIIKGDLRHDSLLVLIQLCLAQAHHCGYLRFACDVTKTEELRSRVATETARQYDEALIKLRNSIWYTGKGEGVKEMDIFVLAMRQVMWARAHLHLGVKHEAEQEIGMSVAYYKRAKDFLAELPKMNTSARISWINSIISSVDAAHRAAEEANGSIFYSRVPSTLPTPDGLPRPLGQPSAVPNVVEFTSNRSTDPFFGITPLHISHMMCRWRDGERHRVHVCVHAARAGQAAVKAKLEELGVPATMSAVSGEEEHRGRVPEPLRSHILKLQEDAHEKQHSDTNSVLLHYDRTGTELMSVLESKFAEVEAELRKEKALEDPYVVSYGVKMWRAVFPESGSMPDCQYIHEALAKQRAEVQQHMVTLHASAKKRLDDNLRDIARLSWPITDLDALMPFSETIEAQAQASKVKAIMQRLVEVMRDFERLQSEQAERVKALNDLLESESVTYDLSAADAALREGILATASQKLTDAMEEVNARTRDMSALVDVASKALEELGVVQSADPLGKEVNEVVNKLEMATEQYRQCLRDLQQVCTYTETAIESANALVVSAQSFLLCRQLQAEELAMSLDGQIAQKVAQMEKSRAEVQSSQQRQSELRMRIAEMEEQQRAKQQAQKQELPSQQFQQQQPSAYSMAGSLNSVTQMQPQQQQQQQSALYNMQNMTLPQSQQGLAAELSTSLNISQQQPGLYNMQGMTSVAPQQQQPPQTSAPMPQQQQQPGLYNMQGMTSVVPQQQQPPQTSAPMPQQQQQPGLYNMQGMTSVVPQQQQPPQTSAPMPQQQQQPGLYNMQGMTSVAPQQQQPPQTSAPMPQQQQQPGLYNMQGMTSVVPQQQQPPQTSAPMPQQQQQPGLYNMQGMTSVAPQQQQPQPQALYSMQVMASGAPQQQPQQMQHHHSCAHSSPGSPNRLPQQQMQPQQQMPQQHTGAQGYSNMNANTTNRYAYNYNNNHMQNNYPK